jgi:hypothetical protein
MDEGKYDRATGMFKTHNDVMTGKATIAQQDQGNHKHAIGVLNTNPAHVWQVTLPPPRNT